MRRLRGSLGLLPLLFGVTTPAAAAVVDYVYVDGFEAQPDCSTPLACPAQSGGKACISGRFESAANGKPVRAFFGAGLTCAQGAVGGPCDLSLSAYDALDFAGNPAGAVPLAGTSKTVDGCGRFRVDGMSPPQLGFVALVTEDADSAPESDLHVFGSAPYELGANETVDGATAIVVRRDTVARWTQSAGSPFGASTFADVGALLLQYRDEGAPSAGVTATVNGNTSASNDYYFSDAIPSDRLFVAAASGSTGANGAALFAQGGSPTLYSGTGGCSWPAKLGSSTPGVVLYLEFDC